LRYVLSHYRRDLVGLVLSDGANEGAIEALRQDRRQRRLEWAMGSWPVRSAPSLASPDWTVDIGLVERQRIVHGWSRRQLATVAHVDPKTLRDLLSGRRRPNLGTLRAVTAALGLTLTEVIRFA
jgi:DNA-binding XRE family transcriptional regulator